jgi:subtilase family serine protease
MRSWKFVLPLLASSLCFAAQPDRITSPIDSSQLVPLASGVRGLSHPGSDLGRTDAGQMMHGVTLVFHPSAAQQADLNNLLVQQQDRSSPNYHKWLTPAQFADRFGMTQDDISRVTSWLESQGFTVTSVANSRNQISFDGTVAQVESVFATQIHNYLVDGIIHFANATNPSVPAAMAASVLNIGHLHNFSPKPRAIVRKMSSQGANPNFTSSVSGSHFLTPGDFATIYHVQALYTDGFDGSNHSIAIIGQSTVLAADLSNFRSAAGLAAKTPQYVLYPSTSTATRCTGDEGESDLDLEWSNGVAPNANVIFVYAGLVAGDTCSNRTYSVWDALFQAIDNPSNYAPVISTSYGFCEPLLESGSPGFPAEVQQWAQQANTQGQTIMAASGDAGAADCDATAATSATGGIAVDVPASIPEVTGMGGTEFTGDAEGSTPVNGVSPGTPYWAGTNGSDTISSALSYIPETAWNDTVENSGLSASGGGASILFAKPTWQTGTGVPTGGMRDVPDLALNASPDHDGYLFCSEDSANGATSCASGFRTASGGDLTVVGGTSAAAPTFAAILTLIEQDLGETGLGNVNPNLYALAASTPSAFHDVTSGNNIVPCTQGTPNCPATAPFQYGFTAGTGYDQVTGLGSVAVDVLAAAWKATDAPDFQFLTPPALNPTPVSAGQSTTTTITIAPLSTGSTGMVVNFSPSSCSGLPIGAACSFNPPAVNFDGTDQATTVLTISTLANMTLPSGAQTITITPTNSVNTSTTVSLTVTATTQSYTIAPTGGTTTFAINAGGIASVPITVGSTTGFINASSNTTQLPLSYTCTGFPAESTCTFSPMSGSSVSATTLTMSIATTAPVTQLRSPLGHGSGIFYALLLPGMFGIVFVGGARTRAARLLSLIVILGFSTLWLGSCGGSSSSSNQKNPGTPAGTYTIVVNSTTGGTNPLTGTFTVNLTVSN